MSEAKSNVVALPQKDASDKEIQESLTNASRNKENHQQQVRKAYDVYSSYAWKPVRIYPGKKRPIGSDWLDKPKPNEDDFNGYDNIGIALGEKSGGLADIDIDHKDLIEPAKRFLPNTGAKFGRYYGTSEQHLAHWLYRSLGDKTYVVKHPLGGTAIEIRSTGGQTIFPPSYIHDNKLKEMDLVCWAGGPKAEFPSLESIPELFFDDLRSDVNLLAATVFCASQFKEGAFHSDMLAWCGLLAKAGYSEEQAAISVTEIVNITGQEGIADRLLGLKDTYWKHTNGEVITGISTLKNGGWDEKYINWLKNILKVKTTYESDGRPLVRVIASKETDLLEHALTAMVETKKFYTMAGQIVIVNRETTRSMATGETIVSAKLIPLPDSISMGSWLTREIQFIQQILDKAAMTYKDQLIKAPPSLSSELSNPHTFRGELPVITTMSTTPLITRSGRIVDNHWGYDEELTTFFACRHPVKIYHPDESLKILNEPFLDFPFALGGITECVTGEDTSCSMLGFKYGRYYAAAISSILAGVVRPAIPICPAYVVTSSQWGDGKSVLSSAIACSVGMEDGTANSPLTRGGSDEEQEKQISSVLARGKRVIIYDNHDGEFRSPALTEVLTSAIPEFRILGKSETKSVPNRAVYILNGVNMVLAGDMQTRSVMIRLARTDLSSYRKFKHHDISGWCFDNSDKLVSASVSLISWALKQADGNWKPTHRFKDWDYLVRRTILLACGVDISPPANEDDDRLMDPMEEVKYEFIEWVIDRWHSGLRDSSYKHYLRGSTLVSEVPPGGQQEGWINILSKRTFDPLDRKLGRALMAVKDFPVQTKNGVFRVRNRMIDKRSVYWVEEVST